MPGRRFRPVFTENFVENLDAIQTFLDLVPTLCRFPLSGRAFVAHSIGSVEARTAVRNLKRFLQPGDDLREFILDEYLLLYLVRGTQVIFLSIKHHSQLSFDLHLFWP